MGFFLPNYTEAYYSIGVSIVRCGVEAGARCDRGIVEDAVDDAYHADTPRMKPRSLSLMLTIEISQAQKYCWTAAFGGTMVVRWGITGGDSHIRIRRCKHVLQVIPRDRAEAPPARAIFYCGQVG